MLRDRAQAIISKISERNRRSRDVKPDENVVVFRSYGYESGIYWRIPFHAWVFEEERNSLWRRLLVRQVADQLGIEKVSHAYRLLEQRARYFMADNERNKRLHICIEDEDFTTGPSHANGHCYATGLLSRDDYPQGQLTATVIADNGRRFHSTIELIPAQGISVISDIDDTIKISHVHDKKQLMKKTFTEEFTPVPGIAALYRRWRDEGASFHYISGSPWQLYPSLTNFMLASGLPLGSFHLRSFRFVDRTLLNMLASPEEYKMPHLIKLFETFPERRFVLVGDMSELDPELYASLYARYPEQILKIFIRRPGHVAEDRTPLATVFATLPPTRWQEFSHVDEITDSSLLSLA